MTREDQQELAERLSTLTDDRPVTVRRQVISALCEAVSHDFGLFFRLVEKDDDLHYSFEAFRGQDDTQEAIDLYDGQPALGVPWLPPNADPGEINRFISPREVYGDHRYFGTDVQEQIYGALEVNDELRALVFDGDQFLGWIGLARRGSGQRFGPDECDLLASVFPQVKAALASARALESETLADDVAATFDPRGRLEHASEAFVRWAGDDRRVWVERRVRAFDAGKKRSGTELYGGAEIRLVRLDTGHGVRYLVTVERAALWTLQPVDRLTHRQQEVADYARCGATTQEIADTLGLSRHTVKEHLRNIYARLGIGSRAELANALSAAGR